MPRNGKSHATRPKKEMPAGFREDVAKEMGVWGLMKKYQVGQLVIERWLGELDLEKVKK